MSKQTEKGLPEAIERVREQFEEWRAHKSGRDRILVLCLEFGAVAYGAA